MFNFLEEGIIQFALKVRGNQPGILYTHGEITYIQSHPFNPNHYIRKVVLSNPSYLYQTKLHITHLLLEIELENYWRHKNV